MLPAKLGTSASFFRICLVAFYGTSTFFNGLLFPFVDPIEIFFALSDFLLAVKLNDNIYETSRFEIPDY
jgi:hypothetical protein